MKTCCVIPVGLLVVCALFTPQFVLAESRKGVSPVKPGIDVLTARGFDTLAGKRVGLITNPTGITSQLRSTIDVLNEATQLKLVALFGPEHGVRGEIAAGERITDALDTATQLPIRSLYGQHRKPTAEMLSDLDVLVFDIQDIGSRSYTFISTMTAAMEAAAENDKQLVVLDRPNPMTGNKIEGRLLDMQFRSFVGYLPIPYVHGMTVGELAQMINGEGWLGDGNRCKLTVVPMQGWRRTMWFDETGLPWVPPSPHVPHSRTPLFYAATGIMGELRVLSEGVGYTLPFELCGAPSIEPPRLADELNSRQLPGVTFRPLFYKPYYATHAGKTCGGVQVYILDRDAAELTAVQFHVLDAVRNLYPNIKLFSPQRSRMFDKVCGTDRIRLAFESGKPIDEVLSLWREGVEQFHTSRHEYLIYK